MNSEENDVELRMLIMNTGFLDAGISRSAAATYQPGNFFDYIQRFSTV